MHEHGPRSMRVTLWGRLRAHTRDGKRVLIYFPRSLKEVWMPAKLVEIRTLNEVTRTQEISCPLWLATDRGVMADLEGGP